MSCDAQVFGEKPTPSSSKSSESNYIGAPLSKNTYSTSYDDGDDKPYKSSVENADLPALDHQEDQEEEEEDSGDSKGGDFEVIKDNMEIVVYAVNCTLRQLAKGEVVLTMDPNASYPFDKGNTVDTYHHITGCAIQGYKSEHDIDVGVSSKVFTKPHDFKRISKTGVKSNFVLEARSNQSNLLDANVIRDPEEKTSIPAEILDYPGWRKNDIKSRAQFTQGRYVIPEGHPINKLIAQQSNAGEVNEDGNLDSISKYWVPHMKAYNYEKKFAEAYLNRVENNWPEHINLFNLIWNVQPLFENKNIIAPYAPEETTAILERNMFDLESAYRNSSDWRKTAIDQMDKKKRIQFSVMIRYDSYIRIQKKL